MLIEAIFGDSKSLQVFVIILSDAGLKHFYYYLIEI